MILEIADIRIKPGQQAQFEKAVQFGLNTVIAKSKGFRGHQVHHSIESPDRYVLMLEWDTLEDHTVGFRESPAFVEWRSIVIDFFAQAPFTEHFELVSPVARDRLGGAS
jgi:heme-degrading monooxygenase HmoA